MNQGGCGGLVGGTRDWDRRDFADMKGVLREIWGA